MAKNRKSARRPDARQQAAQRRAQSGVSAAQRNAQRRQQRRRKSQATYFGWGAVAVVVIAALVIIIVNTTGGKTPSNANGSLRSPASASLISALASVPASVFDSVGTAGMSAPQTVTAKQTKLVSAGLPEVVYEGAEYCPYCAMERWSLVTALDRFGSFTRLQTTSSSSTDTPSDIPTLSFYGAAYTSKYLVFSHTEDENRLQATLETPSSKVASLYATYDGNGSTPSKFSGGGAGIPFIDVANQYVSAGTPQTFLTAVAPGMEGGGVSHAQVASALQNPTSSIGAAIGAKYLIADANFLTAEICAVDGGKPTSVCTSSGVKAAAKVLAAQKPVS